MKKIEDYFDMISSIEVSADEVKEVIKLIITDTIEVTCKKCAKEAQVKAQYKSNLKGSRYRTWKDESEIDLFSTTQKYSVDKKSILKVADKMKEKLNET